MTTARQRAAPRARTVSARQRLSPGERLVAMVRSWGRREQRPRTRADCRYGLRPCPWVGCRHHLYLDVLPNGTLLINFPDVDPWELPHTCALDVAETCGGLTLKGVGALLNFDRERARQIEHDVLCIVRRRLRVERWRTE